MDTGIMKLVVPIIAHSLYNASLRLNAHHTLAIRALDAEQHNKDSTETQSSRRRRAGVFPCRSDIPENKGKKSASQTRILIVLEHIKSTKRTHFAYFQVTVEVLQLEKRL